MSSNLKDHLKYDPDTGLWTWVSPLPRSKMRPGDQAGSVNCVDGYRYIRYASGTYRAARLAWWYMTGEWPELQIDHINRIRNDDRWCNLRLATPRQNRNNKDHYEWRGIFPCGKQFAVKTAHGYLGLFERFEDAKAIRDLSLWYRGGRFANTQETVR